MGLDSCVDSNKDAKKDNKREYYQIMINKLEEEIPLEL